MELFKDSILQQGTPFFFFFFELCVTNPKFFVFLLKFST